MLIVCILVLFAGVVVGNCVGWKNYKFFFLFVNETVLLCVVAFVIVVSHLIEHGLTVGSKWLLCAVRVW